MSIKVRRKTLSLSRQELAERAGIDKGVLQQIELGTWQEGEARIRVEVLLDRIEAGEQDARLEPMSQP
jgi:transcriptional regulator with XRE-family HTH domain